MKVENVERILLFTLHIGDSIVACVEEAFETVWLGMSVST